MADLEADYTSSEFAEEFEASPAQMMALEAYRDHLVEWNANMNLVGSSTLRGFWRRHVLDSAQLLHVEQSAVVWADVGAGAGLPGLVLAILLKGRLGACVHLIESMAKRTRFLELVSQQLDLPVVIHNSRAEDVTLPPELEVVTARACAPLPRLLGYTKRFFHSGTKGLFLKGREVESELTEARRSWTFHAELIPSRSDPSGRIVRIERLAPRGR